MKVFVTGGSGFLGIALCMRLRRDGHEVIAPTSRTADLRDAHSLDAWDATPFDQIYHLAAWTQAGEFCLHHPGEQWIVNQQINTNVLAWWERAQRQAKLISIGTSCVYDPNVDPIEENYLVGMPTESLFTYAMTKRMLYAGLLALSRQFGLKYLCVVPSTLYGPGYHTDGRQMHFIFDLIRKILRGKLYGQPVVLWGDGYQRREVVYRDDFVESLLKLAGKYQNELVNIGTGEEYSIRQFSELICRCVGYDADRIEYDTSRYVGARSKFLRIDKLKRLMPEYRNTELRSGLEKTLEWFRENPEILAKP
ncbi:MAG: NAD-dependent epimerase/dehydratase family protein [Thermoguttaceae bacterium]|jgi:GDP-L-fucose synthase